MKKGTPNFPLNLITHLLTNIVLMKCLKIRQNYYPKTEKNLKLLPV